jgi:predicted N-acetyltransferase YhbS
MEAKDTKIRSYNPDTDYEQVSNLYKDSGTYGGQYDEARDSEEKLRGLSETKPGCQLVAEIEGKIIGTVTIFEDGRFAYLYRFAILKEYENEVSKKLFTKSKEILRGEGHTQVLVFAPSDGSFDKRYKEIGFNKGNDYTAYWQDI